jgi:hypothetical protein
MSTSFRSIPVRQPMPRASAAVKTMARSRKIVSVRETSHTHAVSSLNPVTIRRPSGLKAAFSGVLTGRLMQAISFPLSASHTRIVRSEDAVTSRFPSRLKDAQYTSTSCPSN